MKKMIIMMLAVLFVFAVVEASACATVIHLVVLPAAVGGTAGVVWVGLGVAAVAPLVITSPYWWMFYKHPECRDQPTIGDLSRCVQEKKK